MTLPRCWKWSRWSLDTRKTTLLHSVRGVVRVWMFVKRMRHRRRRYRRCGSPPDSRRRLDCRGRNPEEHRRTISCRPVVEASFSVVSSRTPLDASEAAAAAAAVVAAVVALPAPLPFVRPPSCLADRQVKRMAPPCPPCERGRRAPPTAGAAPVVS